MKRLFSVKPFNKAHFYGVLGEWFVIFVYIFQGYMPLRRRFRRHAKMYPEIDLIFRRGKTLLLVEVKVRSRQAFMHLSVSYAQQKRQQKEEMFFVKKYPEHEILRHVVKLCLEKPFWVVEKK